MPSDRDRENLKYSKKKTIIYKGASIRLSHYSSTETLKVSRDWKGIFKVVENKDLQPRLLYSTRPSFRIEG